MVKEGRTSATEAADEWVIAAAAGDPIAKRRLVEATLPFVHRMMWRLVGRRSEIDDLVQAVYVRAFSALSDFRAEAAFSTWLGAICVNVARTYWVKRPRTQAEEPVELLAVSSGDDTEAVVLARQGLRAVQSALGSLSPHLREVFVLHVLEERDVRTVAAMTGTTVAATYKAIERARVQIEAATQEDLTLKAWVDREAR